MNKPTFGEQMVELLKSSVLIQASITVAVTITVLVMAAQQLEIPAWMLQVLWLTLGFYFGSKVGFVQGEANQPPPMTYVVTPAPPSGTPGAISSPETIAPQETSEFPKAGNYG